MVDRSRNWFMTINYKESEPQDNQSLLEFIQIIPGIVYIAFQLERGETGTYHHQVYLSFKNAKYFDGLKHLFPTAHIEPVKGTPQQASDYCIKENTRIGESVVWGRLPERGERTDLVQIYEMLKEGCSLSEISSQFPSQYMRMSHHIKTVQQDILEAQYQDSFRSLNVVYLCDDPGIGKTRYIMEKYGYLDVFRISNYEHPFDTYKGQKVLVFEEFRNSLPITEMLNYLDGYPIRLPARYEDKVACYTKVYIVSNWGFDKQYEDEKHKNSVTYQAFLRRIHFIGDLKSVKEYDRKLEIEKWEYLPLIF